MLSEKAVAYMASHVLAVDPVQPSHSDEANDFMFLLTSNITPVL